MKLIVSFIIVIITSLIIDSAIRITDYFATKRSKVIEVYILAGQSNAVGYNNQQTFNPAPFPNSFRKQEKVLFWPGSNSIDSLKNVWTTLQIGTSLVGENAFGPEIAFGNKLAATYPDKEIGIIKYAVGGTGIARSKDYSDYIPGFENFEDNDNNWYPPINGRPAGKLYYNLLQNIKNALVVLENQGKKYRLAGFIWMQGEHEAGLSPTMAADYQKLLSAFLANIRKDINCIDLPFVIGQISDKWIYGDTVKLAQKNVCEADLNTRLVSTSDLGRKPNDDSHYTANGMIELGLRFAESMMKFQIEEHEK